MYAMSVYANAVQRKENARPIQTMRNKLPLQMQQPHDHQRDKQESHDEGNTAANSFPGENQSRADRSRLRRGRASSVSVECVGCTLSFSPEPTRTCVGCTVAVCGRQR